MGMQVFGRTQITEGSFPQGSLLICDTPDDLPSSGLHVGDKAIVVSTGAKYYCYNGTAWSAEGGGGPHTHPESEVVNLTTDLAGKEAANSNIQAHVTGTGSPHTAAGVGALATAAFSGLAKITVGTGQPSTPSVGDLWIDTN